MRNTTMGKYDTIHDLTNQFKNTSLQDVTSNSTLLTTLSPTTDQDTISLDAYATNLQLAIIELLK
jgi:hypothetical protein